MSLCLLAFEELIFAIIEIIASSARAWGWLFPV